ncbi:TRAP transporter small permease [Paracoccus sp. MBLB3053]|uniref:TRAP transporter small permease protein n=1 Tax=Paracoccus aurantius TaxID=3073814 RepID=A0ABU2HXV1_9RHOB|nr:TRAP transporter small permease [Paracoccus sp. MBLB3053]MDS9469889.1 TRAP transporter small permease [Paracoccus sp. MBLB3053]
MFHNFNRWLGGICAAISGLALILMALVAFIDSIGRQIGKPLPGAGEYVTFALMIFFFAAMPLVIRDDAHIRVGLFSDLYKPRLTRIERRFTGFFEIVAMAAFGWMMFDQANRLDRFGTLSVYFEVPMAPWIYAAAGFCVVATWFAILGLRHVLTDRGPLPHPHALPDEENH